MSDIPLPTLRVFDIDHPQVWGPPRTVELVREPGKSLGISIVGGWSHASITTYLCSFVQTCFILVITAGDEILGFIFSKAFHFFVLVNLKILSQM